MRTSASAGLCVTLLATFAQAGMVTQAYDWDADDEGFVATQRPWDRVDGGWGGTITGTHSARMVGVTQLDAAASITDLEQFLSIQTIPLTNLTISVDVFKESTSGWKDPTNEPLPAFSAFTNDYSSLIDVRIFRNGTEYSFAAELNAEDGLQSGLALSYLGSRNVTSTATDLQVFLQTFQDSNNTDFSYRIDNLTLTGESDSSQVPEPSTLALLGTGMIGVVCGARRRRNMR